MGPHRSVFLEGPVLSMMSCREMTLVCLNITSMLFKVAGTSLFLPAIVNPIIMLAFHSIIFVDDGRQTGIADFY